MLDVNEHIQIPLRELVFTFARSSGAGGQNVNKVNSKAILSWNISESPSLRYDVKERLKAKYLSRISASGEVIIQSERFRDQPRNIQDCLDKLRQMLLEVAQAPKKRKATRPSRAAKKKRLDSKRRHSDKKKNRTSWD